MRTTIIMSFVLAAAPLLAVCAPRAGAAGEYDVCFFSMEQDGDGLVSRQEFSAAFPDADPMVFVAADDDADSFIDHQEWEDFKAGQGYEPELSD